VVGGFAIRAAGFIRNTMDVDLLIEMRAESSVNSSCSAWLSSAAMDCRSRRMTAARATASFGSIFITCKEDTFRQNTLTEERRTGLDFHQINRSGRPLEQ
jgi:hypothetical protein